MATTKKKKKARKVKLTVKQKKALVKTVENGGNVTKAMREVGYSEATINNPKNLTESKAWIQKAKEVISDEILLDILKEGLYAETEIYRNNVKTGKIENVGTAPDHKTRHRFLETGFKIRGKLNDKAGGEVDRPPVYEPHFHLQVINLGKEYNKGLRKIYEQKIKVKGKEVPEENKELPSAE